MSKQIFLIMAASVMVVTGKLTNLPNSFLKKSSDIDFVDIRGGASYGSLTPKNVLYLTSVSSIATGLLALLSPDELGKLHFYYTDKDLPFIVQLLGTLSIGYGAIGFHAAKEDAPSIKFIGKVSAILYAAIGILNVYSSLNGITKEDLTMPLVWRVVNPLFSLLHIFTSFVECGAKE